MINFNNSNMVFHMRCIDDLINSRSHLCNYHKNYCLSMLDMDLHILYKYCHLNNILFNIKNNCWKKLHIINRNYHMINTLHLINNNQEYNQYMLMNLNSSSKGIHILDKSLHLNNMYLHNLDIYQSYQHNQHKVKYNYNKHLNLNIQYQDNLYKLIIMCNSGIDHHKVYILYFPNNMQSGIKYNQIHQSNFNNLPLQNCKFNMIYYLNSNLLYILYSQYFQLLSKWYKEYHNRCKMMS